MRGDVDDADGLLGVAGCGEEMGGRQHRHPPPPTPNEPAENPPGAARTPPPALSPQPSLTVHLLDLQVGRGHVVLVTQELGHVVGVWGGSAEGVSAPITKVGGALGVPFSTPPPQYSPGFGVFWSDPKAQGTPWLRPTQTHDMNGTQTGRCQGRGKITGTPPHPDPQFVPPPPRGTPPTSHHGGHAAVGVDAADVLGVRGVGAAVEEQR